MVVQSLDGSILQLIEILQAVQFYKRAAYAIDMAFVDFAIDIGFLSTKEPAPFPKPDASKAQHARDLDSFVDFAGAIAKRAGHLHANERVAQVRANYVADLMNALATFPEPVEPRRPTYTFAEEETRRHQWTMSPVHIELAGRIGEEHFGKPRARPIVFSAALENFSAKLGITASSPYPKFQLYPRSILLKIPYSFDHFVLAATEALFPLAAAARAHKTSERRLKPLREVGRVLGPLLMLMQPILADETVVGEYLPTA